ncbi:MAG: hypothetical protein ACXWOH_11315, partial [Bdellovibrionota bacterium]
LRAIELNYAPKQKEARTKAQAYNDAEYPAYSTGKPAKVMTVLEAALHAGEPVLVQYKVVDEDHTQARGEIGFQIHGLREPDQAKAWADPNLLDHYVLAVGAQWSSDGKIERLLVKNTWGTSPDEAMGFHWIEPDYFFLFEGVEVPQDLLDKLVAKGVLPK